MSKKLSAWLHQITNNWVALIALVIFFAFTAIVLPRQAAKAEAQTGQSTSPDTSFTYSVDDLYHMAEAYGEQGRKAYVRARFTFDLIFPVVYVLFLVTAISFLAGKSLEPNSPWMRANLIPVLGATFDYLENISTSLVMWRYPAPMPIVAFLAPVFTFVKWIFVGGSFLILVLGVVGWVWKFGKKAQG
ncbi:MAG: hypothetical protein MAG431_00121 [Chloroflexi bacterium]|nr:hypothetical protein [Chloroflexota bacterium]